MQTRAASVLSTISRLQSCSGDFLQKNLTDILFCSLPRSRWEQLPKRVTVLFFCCFLPQEHVFCSGAGILEWGMGLNWGSCNIGNLYHCHLFIIACKSINLQPENMTVSHYILWWLITFGKIYEDISFTYSSTTDGGMEVGILTDQIRVLSVKIGTPKGTSESERFDLLKSGRTHRLNPG